MKALFLVVVLVLCASLLAPAAPAAAQESCWYMVQQGDSATGIASRYGISMNQLVRENPSIRDDPDSIFTGQPLKVCATKVQSFVADPGPNLAGRFRQDAAALGRRFYNDGAIIVRRVDNDGREAVDMLLSWIESSRNK